jgi:hypothetical protein
MSCARFFSFAPRLALLLLLSLAGLTLPACVTETTELPPLQPLPVTELQRWRVELEGQPVGVLRKMRLEHPDTPELFYLVDHASGQRAGMIDLLGRAYRDDPFSGQRRLVVMAGMTEDLRVLLELPARPEVLPWQDGASAR